MSARLSSHSVWFFLCVVMFRCLLEISYVNVVSPYFSYGGFALSFSFFNYFVSWLIFLIGLFFLRDRLYQVSDIFYSLGFLLVIVPLSVLYGYDTDRGVYPIIVSLVAIALAIQVASIKSISFRKLPIIKNGLRYVILVSAVFVIFLIVWYYVSGVRFNLDLTKVYEFRRDNDELAGGGLLAYTNNWTFKVFNMVLLAVALLYSRYVIAIMILLVQVYFFAASAHKGVLFSPLMIVGIWFTFKRSNSLIFMPAALNLVIVLSLVGYYFFDDLLSTTMFSRRLFFVPANLTYAYFDFFSQNPNVFWSNSLLSSVLDYPYGQNQSMARVIGEFIGYPDQNANNGFISSGFAHAGLIGVCFYSIIIGFILRFLNQTTLNLLPLWFTVSLILPPIRTLLVGSDLLVVMMTHGLLIVLVFVLFVRSKRYEAFER